MSAPDTDDEGINADLGRIVAEELRRENLLELALDEDEALVRVMRRIAMRSYHHGQVFLAAYLDGQGVRVHLHTKLDDDDGIDLLLPPSP